MELPSQVPDEDQDQEAASAAGCLPGSPEDAGSAAGGLPGSQEGPAGEPALPDQEPTDLVDVESTASQPAAGFKAVLPEPPDEPAGLTQKAEDAVKWIDQRMQVVSEALARAPEAVLMLEAGAEPRLPPEVHVVARATTDLHGREIQILVLTLRVSDECGKLVESRDNAAAQLLQLERLLRSHVDQADGSARLFPLHDFDISHAISAFELMMGRKGGRLMLGEADAWPQWKRQGWLALSYLRIVTPREKGRYLSTLRQHYGQAVGFFVMCDHFYVQMLWLLSIVAVLLLALGVAPVGGTLASFSQEEHVKWEVGKVLVIAWGSVVAVASWRSYAVTPNEDASDYDPCQGPCRKLAWRSYTRRSLYNVEESWLQLSLRWGKLVLVALPAFALLLFCGMALIVSITTLILHVIYVWGDCVNLGCRDPQVKHGFAGWLVEVSCDVLLALVFELFIAADELLAQWIADLRNYEYHADHEYCKRIVKLSLSSVERLGFIACLAFLFVPQWTEPAASEAASTYDESVSCAHLTSADYLLLGDGSFSCLQLRLPVTQRRYVFEALMKGPFCVAPFVGIVMKSIVPAVSRKIAECLDAVRTPGARPCQWLFRIAALIFSYDGGAVGGAGYVVRGKPCETITLEKAAAAADVEAAAEPGGDVQKAEDRRREKIEDAVTQSFRREFDVEDDVVEIQMSYLWVLFLMPVKPEGVLFTLLARILDINFDVSKLLYVRRRPFPRQDKVMRQVLTAFLIACAIGSVGFSLGLSLVTYNDDLWTWGGAGRGVMALVLVWLGLSILVMFAYNACGIAHRSSRQASGQTELEPFEAETVPDG